MLLFVILLLLALLLFGLGFAVKFLFWVAIVVAILCVVSFLRR